MIHSMEIIMSSFPRTVGGAIKYRYKLKFSSKCRGLISHTEYVDQVAACSAGERMITKMKECAKGMS